jgi:ABC-2 type transport system ATP-binding protein
VIDRVREDGATVLDLSVRDSSLEDLFSAYTGAAPPAVEAAAAGTPTDGEVDR